MKKTLLVVLDGVGINDKTTFENPFYQKEFPTFKNLFSNLKTSLGASGRSVGIPDGQIGNSEVGHMTIGSGRIIKQNIVKIDDMLDNGDFENLEVFKNGIKHIEKNNSTLHLFTLFGPGGVHSSDTHLEKILKIIPENISVSLHLFGDGRDIAPKSMKELFQKFEENILSKYKNVVVSSIAGRYFAMDRDNNWDRIESAYKQIVFGENKTELGVSDFIENEYKNDKTDEFLTPVFFENGKTIEDNDAIFFLNFRSDRAKQMTKAFVEKDFNGFKIKEISNLYFSTMTKYYREYESEFFIKDEEITNVLADVISKKGLKQIHIAETEKFAHVTKFFNGGVDTKFENEEHILIPSHKVATYDLDPEMSAEEIYEAFEKNINNFDFGVINFANGDMVGHTGSMDAVLVSLAKLDEVVAKLIEICDINNIELLITADHGNCEEMGSIDSPKTAHSTNLVPFWYISKSNVLDTKTEGGLSNIAPTVLDIMGIEIPQEMDESLL